MGNIGNITHSLTIDNLTSWDIQVLTTVGGSEILDTWEWRLLNAYRVLYILGCAGFQPSTVKRKSLKMIIHQNIPMCFMYWLFTFMKGENWLHSRGSVGIYSHQIQRIWNSSNPLIWCSTGFCHPLNLNPIGSIWLVYIYKVGPGSPYKWGELYGALRNKGKVKQITFQKKANNRGECQNFEGYTLVNKHSNGKSTIWRCISFTKKWFSSAMLVYQRVLFLLLPRHMTTGNPRMIIPQNLHLFESNLRCWKLMS